MYRDVVEQIEQVQRAKVSVIWLDQINRTKLDANAPPKQCSGLYFFYTSYSIEELKSAGPPPTRSAVPVASLAATFEGLDRILPVEGDGFRLVYNGIGGYRGDSYDLRTRILQEISATSGGTGSLCIRQTRVNDLTKWRYSFVVLPSDFPSPVEPDVDNDWVYGKHARNLEVCWRLHYGWPLLNTGELFPKSRLASSRGSSKRTRHVGRR